MRFEVTGSVFLDAHNLKYIEIGHISCSSFKMIFFHLTRNRKRKKITLISRQNGTIKLEHQFKIYYLLFRRNCHSRERLSATNRSSLRHSSLHSTQVIRINRYVNIWNGGGINTEMIFFSSKQKLFVHILDLFRVSDVFAWQHQHIIKRVFMV